MLVRSAMLTLRDHAAVSAYWVCVMTRVSSLTLAALLAGAALLSGPAVAQPSQQRSTTAPKPQPAQNGQRGGSSAAQQKPNGTSAKPGTAAKPAAAGPGGAQAAQLASFGDWTAYASGQGRSKICYALTQPKDRLPKELSRDPAYLFVSFRPADNVRNEVAVVMGFPTRDGGEAEAVIGTSSFALVTKGTNAWIRNQTEESQVIASMTRGQSMTVKATSGRGNTTTDRYSLSGFAQALDRARKECS
jgi:hypothetical protein